MTILDLIFAEIYFLTLKEKLFLRKKICSLDELRSISLGDLCQILGRNIKTQNWNFERFYKDAEKSYEIIEKRNIGTILYDSPQYPVRLKETLNPPFMLFHWGEMNFLNGNCVGVVGTRNICQETARAAFEFSKDACADGVSVISGLANGIDTWAHKGALADNVLRNGKTCAVLPAGVDMITPSGNRTLALNIINNGGCLLSEYLPCTPAEPWRYVQRNRIIAGLSDSVVVIQAPPKSGSLITAEFAIEYNRDLFFHEACFCEEAKKISQLTLDKHRTKVLDGKIKTAENYLRDGAQCIKDYLDYKYTFNKLRKIDIGKTSEQLNLF